MNYRLYNYLRLIGVPATQATEIASQSNAIIDIYEQKSAVDNASHGGFAPVIGLKNEFKQAAVKH
jgi:hypothetical protein